MDNIKPSASKMMTGGLQGMYEVAFSETFTALISLQPLVGNQAYMPQTKAIYVLFQMVYSRLMCCLRLQSERPMC